MRVPEVIQFGTKDSVILDCDFTTDNVTGLVVKWFFMDRAQSLDLTFKVSNNVYTQHRALRILNPSTDLTGNYTCVVSTYLAEDKGTKPMTIFVPETRFDMIQDRLEDGYLNIICAVEGVFPKPELIILAGNSALVRVEALPPTVEILCDMQVPLANYFSRKRDIFYRDPPLDLTFKVSNNVYTQHRALRILNPSTDLTGNYTCVVSTYLAEDKGTKPMTIFVPETRFDMIQDRLEDGYLNIICAVEGVFPKPELIILAGNRSSKKSMANCSVPEAPLRVTDEEDLIHSEYSAGSLTHYNVVFFDAADVTRAWISPENLKPFTSNKKKSHTINDKKYKKRLEKAMQLAEKAEKLPVLDRLAEFSFISTYKGAIVSPRKVTKRELEKFQNQLKRKFNVDFPIEVSSESDGEIQIIRENNKRKNVILIGTPKIKKTNPVLIGNDDEDNTVFNNGDGDSGQFDNNKKSKESKLNIETNVATPMRKEATKSAHYNKKPRNIINDIVKEISKNSDSEIKETENTVGGPSTVNSNETFEQCTNEVSPNKSKHPNPDSMAIEVDSSKTYLPEDKTDSVAKTQDFQIRIESPSSDDFDF
ncbi:hypothetical protein MSG28_001806 [Choristoneura fumiferana]|uniref:Uncharacterized protein n=1 Tax=Choristoneura fumiferana TaxID=7141 RepID=A0ACC0KVR1_CHOFU|nr:hypothetical protein MSG28_001806 [Choristoneura fumiferana]